jgi:hypothetical protein
VRCEPAVAESWFIGTGTTIQDESQLLLINPYDDAALVNVSLYGKSGRLDVPGTTGISVGPRSRVVQKLTDWAPLEAWLAVRVEVVAGRVSSGVRRARSVNLVPSGVEWLPRTGNPAERVTVGALPGGQGERTLVVVNPGRDPALVHVEVTRQDGQFVPTELAQIEVPGERTVAVPIAGVLEGKSAALTVESDGVPILAGAYAETRGETGPSVDFVVSAGMPPLDGPALLTDNRIGSTTDTALMFWAPDGNAEVTLKQLAIGGGSSAGKSEVVPIEQGKLVVIALSRAFGRGDPLPVLVTPSGNSAPVFGTRVISEKHPRGVMTTTLGMRSQPLEGVPVPNVSHNPGAWLLSRP